MRTGLGCHGVYSKAGIIGPWPCLGLKPISVTYDQAEHEPGMVALAWPWSIFGFPRITSNHCQIDASWGGHAHLVRVAVSLPATAPHTSSSLGTALSHCVSAPWGALTGASVLLMCFKGG